MKATLDVEILSGVLARRSADFHMTIIKEYKRKHSHSGFLPIRKPSEVTG